MQCCLVTAALSWRTELSLCNTLPFQRCSLGMPLIQTFALACVPSWAARTIREDDAAVHVMNQEQVFERAEAKRVKKNKGHWP